jgi:hypothetical protein
MTINVNTKSCLHKNGTVQLFMSPEWNEDQKGVKVQVVDIFSLQVATGYQKDPEGRLLLTSGATLADGRSWSLAKACQLVRNDVRPYRWIVLHLEKKAWGLFWAGGGLELSREELMIARGKEPEGAIVPATPEALLKLVLAMEDPEWVATLKPKEKNKKSGQDKASSSTSKWKWVAFATIGWALLSTATTGFLAFKLQEQSNQLNQILYEIKK